MFWKSRPKNIELFVRHCHFSTISQHKKRLQISREDCFHNLLVTTQDQPVNITFFLDTFRPYEGVHFVKSQTKFPVIEIKEGTEAGSFLRLLEHVSSLKLHPDTIVYFLEDDYIHRPGWVGVLEEGFTIPQADYVTLYDHKDKYFLSQYEMLKSRLFHTKSCHWRETPSTTNTFAMRFKTLIRDLDVQRAFSQGVAISRDHEKFCKLAEEGKMLISSVPGWSTHTEEEFASPCVDWVGVKSCSDEEFDKALKGFLVEKAPMLKRLSKK